MNNELVQRLIWECVIPVAVLLVTVNVVEKFIAFMKTLFVSCDPNEWGLLMRNGEMVRAGVGLTCFKSPFDQVAKFPAKVNRVVFSTEQVSKEMQGVKVTGMIVWTIFREGQGPFNAYKNLGADLSSDSPRTANDSLTSMSSAIVRSCIANSTIEEMIRNREMVRTAIRKEMSDIVKGWGVWLETVEITDVTISSATLFKDLQANFRESMKRESEFYRMTV